MRILVSIVAALCFIVNSSYGQVDSSVALDSISCNPYNPEDTLGAVIKSLLNDYEVYAHFGIAEEGVKPEYAQKLTALFSSGATVPNDLGSVEQLLAPISINDYAKAGLKKGYQPFLMVAQKSDFIATRGIDSGNYTGYLRLFKVFSDTARLGKEYELGAIYELAIEVNVDSSEAFITAIKLVENKIYQSFLISGYGYQGNSRVLLTGNLNKLVKYREAPKEPEQTRTKSGFLLHAGYLFTDYLYPEAFTNNLNQLSGFSGSEYGYTGGIQFQKVYGKKGVFGILFGLDYEINYYDFEHTNLSFRYETDCDGNQLVDLLGSPYDVKEVDISQYNESGEFTYIRPEIGLFLNLGLGKAANFQLFGAIGNAFVSEANYNATAVVSYAGTKGAIKLTETAIRGFYKDEEIEFSGTPSNLQNFAFYRLGASIDLRLAKWLAFSVMAEYRSSLTYALRFREFNCAFLDPTDERTFITQFDQLSSSRNYQAIGIQAGFKIYIKEKSK